jgi:hypothetical protein
VGCWSTGQRYDAAPDKRVRPTPCVSGVVRGTFKGCKSEGVGNFSPEDLRFVSIQHSGKGVFNYACSTRGLCKGSRRRRSLSYSFIGDQCCLENINSRGGIYCAAIVTCGAKSFVSNPSILDSAK